jgi:hypothetical protein
VLWTASFFWLFFGRVQGARDLYAQFFPETYFLLERLKAGELPLWLPHERLGQPFLALLYTQVFYPPRIVTAFVFGHIVGPNAMHAFHCAWAFVGVFLALRSSGRTRAAAFVGGAAWGFSPFFVELGQNLAVASTASWAGFTWWATQRVLARPSLVRSAVLAGVLGLAFHAGSPEMWLWQGMLVGFAVVSRPRAQARWVLLSVAWSVALSAVVALPALELVREWTVPGTSVEGLLEWSMSWPQLMSIAIPDADFPRADPFFGKDQRFFFTLLLGPMTVVLAACGALRRRAWPLVALALLCVVLGVGSNVADGRLVLLPPFRFFRFPVKHAVGALFAVSVLAGHGFDALRALRRRGEAATFVALVFGLVLGLFIASRTMSDLRSGFVQGMTWVALSVGVGGGLVLVKRWLGASIPLWLTVELIAMPRRHWSSAPATRFEAPSSIAQTIRDERGGRVSIRVDVEDPGTPWCVPEDPEIEAERVVLDSRKRLSVLRFIEEDLRSTSGYGFRDPIRLTRAFAQGKVAYQLAGVTHLVRNAAVPLRFSGPTPSRTDIDDVWLWRMDDSMPRGWAVQRAKVMSDDDALASLSTLAIAEETVVSAMHLPLSGAPCMSDVETTEERPEVVTQRTRLCANSVVVLADSWFPGWTVQVDGQTREPVRTYGFLRGVFVPAGEHLIEWRYEPQSFRWGALVSMGGLLLMVGAFVRGARRVFRRTDSST